MVMPNTKDIDPDLLKMFNDTPNNTPKATQLKPVEKDEK